MYLLLILFAIAFHDKSFKNTKKKIHKEIEIDLFFIEIGNGIVTLTNQNAKDFMKKFMQKMIHFIT